MPGDNDPLALLAFNPAFVVIRGIQQGNGTLDKLKSFASILTELVNQAQQNQPETVQNPESTNIKQEPEEAQGPSVASLSHPTPPPPSTPLGRLNKRRRAGTSKKSVGAASKGPRTSRQSGRTSIARKTPSKSAKRPKPKKRTISKPQNRTIPLKNRSTHRRERGETPKDAVGITENQNMHSKESHPNPGRSRSSGVIGMKVRKFFENYGEYIGVIIDVDEDNSWHKVKYRDGDVEELSSDEVLKYSAFHDAATLAPGKVDANGFYYSSLSAETPMAIAPKVGCTVEALMDINQSRLSRTGCKLRKTSEVKDKTIFFLPSECDQGTLKALM